MIGRGSKRPSPLSMMTTCRVPLSMTADDGTARRCASPAAGSDFDLRIHLVFDPVVRVLDFDPNFGGSG